MRGKVDHFGYSEVRDRLENPDLYRIYSSIKGKQKERLNQKDGQGRRQGCHMIDVPWEGHIGYDPHTFRPVAPLRERQIVLEAWYKNNNIHGPFEYRFSFNNLLEEKGDCIDGKYNGLIQKFYPDGELCYEGYYEAHPNIELENPIGIHYVYAHGQIMAKVNMAEMENPAEVARTMIESKNDNLWRHKMPRNSNV